MDWEPLSSNFFSCRNRWVVGCLKRRRVRRLCVSFIARFLKLWSGSRRPSSVIVLPLLKVGKSNLAGGMGSVGGRRCLSVMTGLIKCHWSGNEGDPFSRRIKAKWGRRLRGYFPEQKAGLGVRNKGLFGSPDSVCANGADALCPVP